MIYGSEKRNRQLAFELQNSHVCEKRSKTLLKHAEFFLEDTKIVQVRKAVPVGWSGTNRRQLVQHIMKEIHSTFYSMEHMY